MEIKNIRIHGDNILECERTLHLIAISLDSKAIYQDSPIHNPIYTIKDERSKKNVSIQLFPGYNRWGIDIYKELQKLGAPLREATDSLVTRNIDGKEEIIFSIEYCNALPAGNNAWQRTGRALTSASVDIPYIYVSDVGGVELDQDRKQKAPRFPNPIIPFSYITLGKNYNSITLPIYLPSPTISKTIDTKFKEAFGFKEMIALISNLISGSNNQEVIKAIIEKNLKIVNILSSHRKRVDTFRGKEWSEFLDFQSSVDRLHWLEGKNVSWKKKSAEKVSTTPSFSRLLAISKKLGMLSIGAGDIPICLIPGKYRKTFVKEISGLYKSLLDKQFLDWVAKDETPLTIIWITGFKPKGDDSRPDRGLVPLARMLLGPEAKMLSIIYGPAYKATWVQLRKDYKKLAIQNGLWEAILNLSDALLVDSVTCEYSPFSMLIERDKKVFKGKIKLPISEKVTKFSEQDVDSVIHFIFSINPLPNLFECMCNPPGGDWSGLSIKDFKNDIEYRWTSLPRVSKSNGKRPDHVIQYSYNNTNFLFSIESKDTSKSFEDVIGTRLNRYTKDLISSVPTAIKKNQESWGLFTHRKPIHPKSNFISVGAFNFKSLNEMETVLKNGRFDLVLGLEFKQGGEMVIIHIKPANYENPFIEIIKKLVSLHKKRLEINVH